MVTTAQEPKPSLPLRTWRTCNVCQHDPYFEARVRGSAVSYLHDTLVARRSRDLEADNVVATGEAVGDAAVQAVDVLDHLGLDGEGGALAGRVEEDAEGASAVAVVDRPRQFLRGAGLEGGDGVASDLDARAAVVGPHADVLQGRRVGQAGGVDEAAVGTDRGREGQEGGEGGEGLHVGGCRKGEHSS